MFLDFGYHIGITIFPIHLASFLMVFYFITNKDTNLFNKEKYPLILNASIIILLFSIFISFVNSPYISFQLFLNSVTFTFFIFVMYVISKTVDSTTILNKYFNLYVIIASIAGLIIIVYILTTGRLRSTGISGYPYMGIVPNVLLILVFKNFIFSKPQIKHTIFFIILFITIITTQSRFAWLAFVLSLAYGLILTYSHNKEFRKYLQIKLLYIVLLFLFLAVLLLFSNLGDIISSRVGDISFNFFEVGDDKEMVSTSMETRLLIWAVAYNMFIHNPITGVGFFMFSSVSEIYNNLPDVLYIAFVEGLDAHTVFLNFLCETGIIGLSAFIFFLVVIYYYSFKSIKYSKNDNQNNNSIILNILIFSIITTSVYSGAYSLLRQNTFEMCLYLGLSIGNYLYLSRNFKTSKLNAKENE